MEQGGSTRASLAALLGVVELICAESHDLGSTLDAIAESARGLFNATGAGVHLLNGERTALEVRHQVGAPDDPFRPQPTPGAVVPLTVVTRRALETGRLHFTSDYQHDPEVSDAQRSELSWVASDLVVPLVVAGEPLGILYANWSDQTALTDDELEIAGALGRHAAIAVRTARLVESERASREAAEERLRRLAVVEQISAAANAAGDLDQLLRNVLAQAMLLIGADRGMVALVDPDRSHVRARVGIDVEPELIAVTVRRMYALSDPDEDIFALVARTGEQLVADDNHPSLHRQTTERFNLFARGRTFTPITQGGMTIGVLYVGWVTERRANEEELATLRLVAEQVGGAVALARLLEASQRAEARLSAVLDAIDDAVLVYDRSGALQLANRAARHRGAAKGGLSATIDAARELRLPRFLDGTPTRDRLFEPALRGETSTAEITVEIDGEVMHLHVVASPVRGGENDVTGVVVVARDVSELHDAVEQRAQLDGAVKTARRVAHDLNNALTYISGIGEVLPLLDPPEAARAAQSMADGALRAAATLHRLQRIVRFEETDVGGGPMLDLERATGGDPGG